MRLGAVNLIGNPWHYSIAHMFRGLAIGGLLTAILHYMSRERDAQRRHHRERLARVAIEKQGRLHVVSDIPAQLDSAMVPSLHACRCRAPRGPDSKVAEGASRGTRPHDVLAGASGNGREPQRRRKRGARPQVSQPFTHLFRQMGAASTRRDGPRHFVAAR